MSYTNLTCQRGHSRARRLMRRGWGEPAVGLRPPPGGTGGAPARCARAKETSLQDRLSSNPIGPSRQGQIIGT
jgi:hypothetical protein